jgi:hypothetical protein
MSLALDLTPDRGRLTGQVAGDGWTSSLLAHRMPPFSAANPCPWAGRYTFRLAGASNGPASGPEGHGVAALSVGATGGTTVSGTLADGTKLAGAAAVSVDGLWPLGLLLPGNRGSLLGWSALTNAPLPRLDGSVDWVRKADPSAASFRAGFTNRTTVEGAGYSSAAATNFLASQPTLCLTVRGLAPERPPDTRCLQRIGQLAYAGDGFRQLTLQLSTGLWNGLFTNPVTRAVEPVRFTLLLPDGAGFGCLPGTNGSAVVERRLP